MKRQYLRRMVVFEDHFKEFRKTLDKEALKNLNQVFILIMTVRIVPVKFLKAIEGRKGLYEIRMEHDGSIYRVFCSFDEENLIVLFNGFQKKSQRLPTAQLEKAESLMKKYYEQKHK